jgi:YVTN family beta-propeller protein
MLRLIHFLLMGLPLAGAVMPCHGHAFFMHFEGRQTHPIAVQADGARLFAVNTPHARLSVFDIANPANPEPVLVAEIPVGLEPVSVRPRTPDEVWVVNELSDSISIISLEAGCVVATLPVADEPADVVFAAGKAFVSCARNQLIRVIDPVTRREVSTISLDGVMPRSMAVSPDGLRLFVACFLSGNGTTVLPASAAPAPPPPENPALPAAPHTGLIVPSGDPRISYTVLDHDVAEIDPAAGTLVRWQGGVGTNLFDVVVHPVTGEVWTAHTEAANTTRYLSNLQGRAVASRLSRVAPHGGVPILMDLNPAVDYAAAPTPASLAEALAQPTALIWQADGRLGWVAAFGSDRVAQVDEAGQVLARVDVRPPPPGGQPDDSRHMRGPRGLALHPAAPRLYVLNRISHTISVIDTTTASVVAETRTASHQAMPEEAHAGRGFIFDARLSRHGTLSCASCHLEADRDGLAWDLGDPAGGITMASGKNTASGNPATVHPRPMHPMKGPMLTLTLKNAFTGSNFNWRGDEAATTLRDMFSRKLGGTALTQIQYSWVVEYLLSLQLPPNPNRSLDNSLPASLNGGDPAAGRALFQAQANQCIRCHSGSRGANYNIDRMEETGSPDFVRTAPLETLYQRGSFTPGSGVTLSGYGWRHDGTGESFPAAHPLAIPGLTPAGYADVAAWLRCFDTGVPPVTGHSLTFTVENRDQAALTSALSLMEQAAARDGRVELVARGRAGGRFEAWLADSYESLWYPDTGGDAGIDSKALLGRLQPGDALTILGVLRGTGPLYSVDHNDNGVMDRDEPRGTATLRPGSGGLHLAVAAPPGWMPQWSDHLPGPWRTLTVRPQPGPWETIFPEVAGPPIRFFRLRRTW